MCHPDSVRCRLTRPISIPETTDTDTAARNPVGTQPRDWSVPTMNAGLKQLLHDDSRLAEARAPRVAPTTASLRPVHRQSTAWSAADIRCRSRRWAHASLVLVRSLGISTELMLPSRPAPTPPSPHARAQTGSCWLCAHGCRVLVGPPCPGKIGNGRRIFNKPRRGPSEGRARGGGQGRSL